MGGFDTKIPSCESLSISHIEVMYSVNFNESCLSHVTLACCSIIYQRVFILLFMTDFINFEKDGIIESKVKS